METEYLSKFINNVTFFKAFTDHEKGKLVGDKSTFKKYKKDANIFLEGENGSSLFVILFGSVDLIKLFDANVSDERVSLKSEKEKVVGDLSAGSVFGQISMLTNRKRSVTARVTSPSAVVMELTNKFIDSLIPTTQIKFHKQLLLALVQDLDDMDMRYLKLKFDVMPKANLAE